MEATLLTLFIVVLASGTFCLRLLPLAALSRVDLTLRAGEILGLAGVMGNGQRELLEAILGLTTATGGTVEISGRDVTGHSVRRRVQAGLAYVPEDRQARGLVLSLSAEENLALGLLDDEDLWRGPLLRAPSRPAPRLRRVCRARPRRRLTPPPAGRTSTRGGVNWSGRSSACCSADPGAGRRWSFSTWR